MLPPEPVAGGARVKPWLRAGSAGRSRDGRHPPRWEHSATAGRRHDISAWSGSSTIQSGLCESVQARGSPARRGSACGWAQPDVRARPRLPIQCSQTLVSGFRLRWVPATCIARKIGCWRAARIDGDLRRSRSRQARRPSADCSCPVRMQACRPGLHALTVREGNHSFGTNITQEQKCHLGATGQMRINVRCCEALEAASAGGVAIGNPPPYCGVQR